jgi:hypothetical protein
MGFYKWQIICYFRVALLSGIKKKNDYKILVELIKPGLHVVWKWSKYIYGNEIVGINTSIKNKS